MKKFNFFSIYNTQLRENPVKLNNFICCDCRRAFIFDTITHKIKEFDHVAEN